MSWYGHFRSTVRSSPWHINLRLFSITPSLRSSLPNVVGGSSRIPWFTSIPSFRQQVARTNKVPSFGERVRCPSIKNQVLFFGVGSILAFILAAETTNSETFLWSVRLASAGPIWKGRPPSNDEMRRARYYAFGKTLQQRLALIKEAVEDWPQTLKALVIWSYIQVAQPILDTVETKRWCWAIGAVNGMLYFAWHFPRTKHIMRARFAHNPLSGLSYTMLTSLFSHRSLAHVTANSMLIAAFGSATSQYLFTEQSDGENYLREATPKWHFLAFFLSAGLFSNLVSHVAFSRITYPRMIARLRSLSPAPPKSSETTTVRSFLAQVFRRQPKFASSPQERVPLTIGASGAVYALLTVTALAYPDSSLAFHIPPTFPLSAQFAVGSLIAFDIIGIWRAWRRFNHWAHLGGAAFGAFYWAYGPRVWEVFREISLGTLPSSLTYVPHEAFQDRRSEEPKPPQ
ncbi:hypothetical protein DAEQUDRAFT_723650 [Daedalea quercina L-15889]|uniref:Peptidase S54 rhomboid domain-containing protein n=1 Tax=Daedalea quercina L-15889 TaxID=1314783 RepID=A0A165SHP4_9APHY|nr:hypothetical protein DAEQUDRAFT_723650 [Daedalea quercina L-15889]